MWDCYAAPQFEVRHMEVVLRFLIACIYTCMIEMAGFSYLALSLLPAISEKYRTISLDGIVIVQFLICTAPIILISLLMSFGMMAINNNYSRTVIGGFVGFILSIAACYLTIQPYLDIFEGTWLEIEVLLNLVLRLGNTSYFISLFSIAMAIFLAFYPKKHCHNVNIPSDDAI